jgi:YHS domain-containing protein
MAEKVLDVVCRMLVDPDTAPAATTYQAQAHYFCGPACQVAFEENPEQYLQEASAHHADERLDPVSEEARNPWGWPNRA